jgi:uncharacterized protein YjeT (DUF2065 family)
VRTALATILGLGLVANGLWMLSSPRSWYLAVPGVPQTGAANAHFIRDVGCAYMVVGLSLLWLARSPKHAWPAALAGGSFLTLHALVHTWDFFAGREPGRQLVADLPAVFIPAILVVWLAWPRGREPETEK